MRVITFKVDDEMLELLDEIARMRGTSRSAVIRDALRLYFKVIQAKVERQYRMVKIDS